jgi:hypothetical protein
MMENTKWFSRFAVALGGFLIFVGILIVGIFLVGTLGIVDFTTVEPESLQGIFMMFLLIMGLIDLFAGVILWRR